jgi:signal transduction histidine kinase
VQRVRLSGVRTRILAIAFVPSLALFGIGVGYTIYLNDEAGHTENFSRSMTGSLALTKELMSSVEQERLLSISRLSGLDGDPRVLADTRARVDKALAALNGTGRSMSQLSGSDMDQIAANFDKVMHTQLPALRTGVDTGTVPITDVYSFYTGLLDGADHGSRIVGSNSPTIATAIGQMVSLKLFQSVEAGSRSTALTVAAATGSLPPGLLEEFRNNVGLYHSLLDQLVNDMDPAESKLVADLRSGPALARVSAMEDALLRPAPARPGADPVLPMSIDDWRAAANTVNDQLFGIALQQNRNAMTSAAELAHTRSRAVLVSGGSAIALAVLVFAIAVLLANRIIGRLRRLRTETLALAEERLPETMRKLEAGEHVEPESEAARLDFGTDEIGEVAQAFNRAHTAAIGAAITEARTREGVRAVFLNIAHRSQIVVARQLELLDEAESKQEDPALLDTFFRLDHLATRERRNAENLTILGGGKPGRQWRRPVPLMELVRSAVAETLDYARVDTHRLPPVFVLGNAVADLMHLLAELVDNATAFSPSHAQVDVTGNSVGKGVVVEISDQGMGIPADELARHNEMLSNPPDFGLTTLSGDSRLGLFVVAQLAARHGISVRLSDSDYGGIRAIVLVPMGLITTEAPVANRPRDRAPVREPVMAGSAVESQAVATTYAPEFDPAAIAPVEPVADTGRGAHRRSTIEPPDTDFLRSQPEPETRFHRPVAPPAGPGRPPLPRRSRQASIAPELTGDPAADVNPYQPPQSADQARDRMSAIENGTRQGRRARPGPAATGPVLPNEQEGDDDRLYRS